MAGIILEIILIFLTFYFPGIVWQNSTNLKLNQNFTSYMLQFISVAIPQILLIVYIIWLTEREKITHFGIRRIKLTDITFSLLIVVILFACLTPLGLIVIFMPEKGREIISTGFRWKLDTPYQLGLALIFSITVGYREELFFRSYLLTRLKKVGINTGISVAATVLIFALGHLYQGFLGFIIAAIQGSLFTFIFLKKRNLNSIAIAHGLYNFIVLTITLFPLNLTKL